MGLPVQVSEAMQAVMRSAQLPGIGVAVARGQAAPQFLFVGTDAAGAPLGNDSLFPVASISKLATALAVLRLVDQSDLGLDAPLGNYLPQAAASQPGVTMRTLLSHSAGLPLDVAPADAPYQADLSWAGLASACLRTPLVAAPATRVQYSNVGYGLLALVVEQHWGQRFSDALEALVLQPLAVEGYLGREPLRAPMLLADVRGIHRGSRLEPFNSAFWRSLGLPWAGLVTTLDGVLRLVRAFAPWRTQFLQPGTRHAATENQTFGLGGGFGGPLWWPVCPWGLGPELRGVKTPHWIPPEVPLGAFGHTGGSGCLAWYDPNTTTAWAIMGTRTADSGWLLRKSQPVSTALIAVG